ncbi:hypothetical protein M5689_010927 [Euphorbia peplus]|nr:hypothetical protein M5689_010927 [Euphorbia peplus]
MAQENVSQVTITHILANDEILSESRVFTSRFLDDEVKSTLPISKWISSQNWNSFVSLNDFFYPKMVTEFYQNLHFKSDEEDVVHSVIDGVDFEVSRASISQAISIDDEGIIIGDDGSAEGFSEVNWAKPVQSAKETYATWLTQHQRWAHYLTTNVFLPKSGAVNGVSNRERVFMYHLMNEKKINLPAMIIRQMKNVKVGSALAYGSLLTRLFESAGIEISGEGVTSKSTPIKLIPLTKLQHSIVPKKSEGAGSSVVVSQKENVKVVEQKGKTVAKGGKGKKKPSKLVVTVEKVVTSEPPPSMVQATINIEPSGKVVAEKPSEAAKKAAEEAEKSRLAELARAAEAEKEQERIVSLAELSRREKEAAEVAEKLAEERLALAKAKEDARLEEVAALLDSDVVLSEVAEEDNAEREIPLSQGMRRKKAANRRVLNKKDLFVECAELEDAIPSEEEFLDEDMLDVSEGDFGAPIFQELSEDSDEEVIPPEVVLKNAKEFAETIDNDDFMDNVLLGQGRNPGERDARTTIEKMAHLDANPISSFDPNVPEGQNTFDQALPSPSHTPVPSPIHSSQPSSVPTPVSEVSASTFPIPPIPSTSEDMPLRTIPSSGSYSEVNVFTAPLFSDSVITSSFQPLQSEVVFPSIGLTTSISTPPTTIPTTILSTLPPLTTQNAPSSTSHLPQPSSSGHTPPVCDPLTTSNTPTPPTYAGIRTNYEYLFNHLNRDEMAANFGSFGIPHRAPAISAAGGVPSVDDLRRMSQSGSDGLLNNLASFGQRTPAADLFAQGMVLQELQALKAQNLQLMTMLQLQNPSVFIQNLSTLHLAAYDEFYKLRQLALTLPTLENIAHASASNVNEHLSILQQEVREANEHFESQEKVLPAKIDDLQSTINHVLREVKSSAQGPSSSGAAKVVYDITPDLNNRLQSIESLVNAQNAQIAELTEFMKVLHSQSKEHEKILHNNYRFVRGQTYLQNEYLTAAVYLNNQAIKLLLEDAQKQRPQTGPSLPEMKKLEAEFKQKIDQLNALRPNKHQLDTALQVQQKLMSQGALGRPVVYGQMGEKPAQQGGPGSGSGSKRSGANASSSGGVPPFQKKPRNT